MSKTREFIDRMKFAFGPLVMSDGFEKDSDAQREAEEIREKFEDTEKINTLEENLGEGNIPLEDTEKDTEPKVLESKVIKVERTPAKPKGSNSVVKEVKVSEEEAMKKANEVKNSEQSKDSEQTTRE